MSSYSVLLYSLAEWAIILSCFDVVSKGFGEYCSLIYDLVKRISALCFLDCEQDCLNPMTAIDLMKFHF